MKYEAPELAQKREKFDGQWSPRVITAMNDCQFKLARLKDDVVWHDHADTDETFIVLEGSLRIEFSAVRVDLVASEMYVLPGGGELTASGDVWV